MKMASWFNVWIQIFDENNFKQLENVPEQLKTISMLYISIQKEFRKLETSLGEKIETLKKKSDVENLPKENIQDNATKIQSPILERRKSRSKKFKKCFDFDSTDLDSFASIEDDDICDTSIIPETPNIKKPTKILKRKLNVKKKPDSRGLPKNSTLTQIFSDRTEPSLTIDEILRKVDDTSTIIVKEKTINQTNEKPKMSSSFLDYDEIPKRVKSPKKKFVFKETVRGNARKKLPGWSCKDCEDFYKGMGLTVEELEKKMNECSKHRSRFKPDEETMAGYWNLSIPPTPECQKTQKPEASLSQLSQESVGHNSTIFL